MTRIDKIQKIRNALVSVLPTATYHYTASTKHGPEYIVWQEEQSNDLKANNVIIETGMSGTVDLFTTTEYSPLVASIEEALEGAGASVEINSVQYETDTELIHYEFLWSI